MILYKPNTFPILASQWSLGVSVVFFFFDIRGIGIIIIINGRETVRVYDLYIAN
jgi:hypothetical protein